MCVWKVKDIENLLTPPKSQTTKFKDVEITIFIVIFKNIINVRGTNFLKFINVEHSFVQYKPCCLKDL